MVRFGLPPYRTRNTQRVPVCGVLMTPRIVDGHRAASSRRGPVAAVHGDIAVPARLSARRLANPKSPMPTGVTGMHPEHVRCAPYWGGRFRTENGAPQPHETLPSRDMRDTMNSLKRMISGLRRKFLVRRMWKPAENPPDDAHADPGAGLFLARPMSLGGDCATRGGLSVCTRLALLIAMRPPVEHRRKLAFSRSWQCQTFDACARSVEIVATA